MDHNCCFDQNYLQKQYHKSKEIKKRQLVQKAVKERCKFDFNRAYIFFGNDMIHGYYITCSILGEIFVGL